MSFGRSARCIYCNTQPLEDSKFLLFNGTQRFFKIVTPSLSLHFINLPHNLQTSEIDGSFIFSTSGILAVGS